MSSSIINIFNQTPSDHTHPMVIPTHGCLNSKHVILFATPARGAFAGGQYPWIPCYNAVLETFNKMGSNQKEHGLAIPCLEAEFYPGNKEQFDAEVAGNAIEAAVAAIKPGVKIIFCAEKGANISRLYQNVLENAAEIYGKQIKEHISIEENQDIVSANTSAIALPKRSDKAFHVTISAEKTAVAGARAIAAAAEAKAKALKDQAEVAARAEKEKAEQAKKAEQQALVRMQELGSTAKECMVEAQIAAEVALKAYTRAEMSVKGGYDETAQAAKNRAMNAANDAHHFAWKAVEVLGQAQKVLGDNPCEALIKEKQKINDIANKALSLAREATKSEDKAGRALQRAKEERSAIRRRSIPRWEGTNKLGLRATIIDRNLVEPVHYIDTPDAPVKQNKSLENPYSSVHDEIDREIEVRLQALSAAKPTEEDSDIVIVEIDRKEDK